ncbi:ubiquinone anaerobic biosynthesis accessory factor UbiT [Echinimonas agarilytica]|uniref:Ubiquinone biosynthesis accessory factor UbiT n=1 Tax=Echinimonas agarilytica TaxID=1215918 RepID=A0AA41W9W0_9GAMM|nr:SCP2 sterol-binding domain-containing protein [Echinimonas agarilytica]MCM2680751.1 SCP2 sterol-binding domain-containing protein [Echinimonas agarilytica]
MLNKLAHIALHKGPSVLRYPIQHVPFALQKKPIDAILNRFLKEAIDDGDLEFLEQRWLCIQVSDLDFGIDISVVNNVIVSRASNAHTTADVTFTGNSKDLLILATRYEDPDALFFQRRLQINGNTELGLGIKNVIDGLDWEKLPAFVLKSLEVGTQLLQRSEQYQQSLTSQTLNETQQSSR